MPKIQTPKLREPHPKQTVCLVQPVNLVKFHLPLVYPVNKVPTVLSTARAVRNVRQAQVPQALTEQRPASVAQLGAIKL